MRAYEVLSDPGTRQMYDMGAGTPTSVGAAAAAGPSGPGFSPLSGLVGRFFAADGALRDIGVRLELDLAECSSGTTCELTVDTAVGCPNCSGKHTAPRARSHPCDICHGHGWAATRRTIMVRIPAGVEDGTQIQLPGAGKAGLGGCPPGDLFLEITQRPHPIFERHGDDLHCTVTIPMVAAALGATLSVDSLDGPAGIDIRPGTQSGQVILLYGYGVRHLHGEGRGDLVVHVRVETPARLDADQQQLLRTLAMLRAEETPPGPVALGQHRLLSRLADASNGR